MVNKTLITSERYHQQLSSRYDERKVTLTKEQLRQILRTLGFSVRLEDISESFGNMNRTYLTSNLVIKIRGQGFVPKGKYCFLANKMVSDSFSHRLPVVNALAYDHFEKTPYEVLVMERGKGTLLLDDFLTLNRQTQEKLFGQMVEIANEITKLKFSDYGYIKDADSYSSFRVFLKNRFLEYCTKVIERNLADPDEVEQIRDYFISHLDAFKTKEESSFIHTDLHIGNVLHRKSEVTLIYDFDSAVKGPKVLMLPKLIATLDNLIEIIEGTEYVDQFSHQKFEHLHPILKEKLPDLIFSSLVDRQMNLILIFKRMRWISQDWSHNWNKFMIKKTLEDELVSPGSSMNETYYSKILNKIREC